MVIGGTFPFGPLGEIQPQSPSTQRSKRNQGKSQICQRTHLRPTLPQLTLNPKTVPSKRTVVSKPPFLSFHVSLAKAWTSKVSITIALDPKERVCGPLFWGTLEVQVSTAWRQKDVQNNGPKPPKTAQETMILHTAGGVQHELP